ncbi:alpha/beta hydrolase, partial [Klebsiella oxytoca]
LYKKLEDAGCDVTLLEIEDADHADIRFFQKEVWQSITLFFKEKLVG